LLVDGGGESEKGGLVPRGVLEKDAIDKLLARLEELGCEQELGNRENRKNRMGLTERKT
jgi:hypothetical protein